VATVLTAQQSGGAAGAPTRVAVCDVANVFNHYQRAKAEETKFEARRKAVKDERDKRSKEIEQIQADLKILKPSSVEHQQKLNKMEKLAIDLRAWLQYQDTIAARDHHRLTSSMLTEAMNIITQVARERGIQLVLYREGPSPETKTTAELLRIIRNRKVLYAADTIDITNECIRRLNANYARRSGGQ